MGNPNKDKNKEHDGEAALTESITSPQDACHTNRDLSQEREARDATLAKTIAKAVAREMAKTTKPYSMRKVQLQCQPALRLLLVLQDSR